MAIIDPQLDPHGADSVPLWKRLGWMVAIWLGSVLALGVVAAVLRMWLKG
ncbi:DUF2474 domain-containing protein [Novosphingobium olei]|uniref:DUF2474 domain-containing protein n=1 Tax=Novosphingobium olei TaxID=2728851 RepID=A0A7Y0G9C3_9SPHN|nr:DUF2474 domain-containing protein [Novosphingobium olei]NML92664.1 DUF2474 domain-containing protein [Novosphingobium olei]